MSELSAHRRSRIHEAGHAVIGYVLGLGAPVEVTARAEHGGSTRGQGWGRPALMHLSEPEWRDYLDREAIHKLAGEAALEVFGDPNPRLGAGPDREGAARAVAAMKDPSVSVADFRRRAVAMAQEHKAAIARFADEMARRDDKFSGLAEIRAALDAALADAGEPVGRPALSGPEFTAQLRASIDKHRAEELPPSI